MNNKKLKYILAALLTVLLVFGISGKHDDAPTSQNVADAATKVPGKGSPSATPIGLFGIYMNTGFSLQPTDQYTYVDNPKTLTTATAHSVLDILNVLGNDHFQWYQSTNNGVTWTPVTNGKTANLTVTPTQTGTVYYQQSFEYYLIPPVFLHSYYYSNVVAVQTLPDPINATALNVTTDDNYLYNNQSTSATTHAHATPTPANSTGTLQWSIDNNNLATIDPTTGEITANTKGLSGTVKVTGTMINYKADPVTASTNVEIGGGLNDQTVDQGKTATFNIKGNFGATPDSIVWHKVDTNNKDTVISSGTSSSYTTPATTVADSGTKYYAVIKATVDGHLNTITTNKANLNVNVDRTPKVIISSKMENLTNNDGNTDHELTNVMAGDQAKISGTINDENADSNLANGTFSLTMPGDISNTTLYIDGKEYNYGMPVPDGNGNAAITAKNIDFTSQKQHTFELDFTSNTATNKQFTTTAQLSGKDSSGNALDTYNGEGLTLDFIDGLLHADANNVNFGTLTYGDVGDQVNGTIDGNYLLNVTDNRRDKNAQVITLRQNAPFNNGSHDLAAILSFDNNGEMTQLNTADQQISSTQDDVSVPSIGPNNSQTLKLQLSNAAIQVGNYTTTLDWTITSAP
ncbi:hypothetical protein ABM34_11550 [Companilactobacillus ginsenosidimutans]|uniref:BIG2 domain-containing protein n=2 Tax=Companilactobacillus ginsenosidimutans TaxID=1007676 RepID=A0A0H4QLW1_9LACO|nr:hypothetical protein ABM34_11550 [Companilactobacillus ginsenosidimutans]